jgi:putative ABC transport system ATP-binding protein
MLKVDHAGRRIRGSWIWRNLAFALSEGERIAVTGPTGSGKTLLLRSLAGIDRLDEGRVIFEGKPLDQWVLPRYRSRVLLVPQITDLVEGSVEDNLRLPWQFRSHRNGTFDRERIGRWLARFERGEQFLSSWAGDLSGGERQIVGFLRAIQLRPRILLLDEPTASLDPRQSLVLEEIVREWLSESGERAAVWTSHRPEQLARVSDRSFELVPATATAVHE